MRKKDNVKIRQSGAGGKNEGKSGERFKNALNGTVNGLSSSCWRVCVNWFKKLLVWRKKRNPLDKYGGLGSGWKAINNKPINGGVSFFERGKHLSCQQPLEDHS
jgi:hypothetical protein